MGGLHEAGDTSKDLPMNTPLSSVNIRRATMGDMIRLYEKAFEGWELTA
jgi:hypothetical protein